MASMDFTNHNSFNELNNGDQLQSNGYFLHNLTDKFTFYNSDYDVVYVNENGYITFDSGESGFIQNLYQNHFSKKNKCFFTNLQSYTDSDIKIGLEIMEKLLLHI